MEQAKEHIDTFFPAVSGPSSTAGRGCGVEEGEGEEEEGGSIREAPSAASEAVPVLGEGRGCGDAPPGGPPSSCCWWESEEADPELIRRYARCPHQTIWVLSGSSCLSGGTHE